MTTITALDHTDATLYTLDIETGRFITDRLHGPQSQETLTREGVDATIRAWGNDPRRYSVAEWANS